MITFSPFFATPDEAWTWANGTLYNAEPGVWHTLDVYPTRKLRRWRVKLTQEQALPDGPIFSRAAIALITLGKE